MRKDGSIAKREGNLKAYIMPPVDMYQTPDSYVMFLDMPGVTRENLKIKVVDDTLIIQGNFEIHVSKDDEILFNELMRGEYKREFILPGDVDKNKIEAKLVNGVLILTLGKKEESREIEIKIN